MRAIHVSVRQCCASSDFIIINIIIIIILIFISGSGRQQFILHLQLNNYTPFDVSSVGQTTPEHLQITKSLLTQLRLQTKPTTRPSRCIHQKSRLHEISHII